MFHEHNPYLTSVVRKSKRILQERGNQDKSPSYIYIMNSKCLDVTLSKGNEGKKITCLRKKESTNATVKFWYNNGKISRV
jgi:hypothetical protein